MTMFWMSLVLVVLYACNGVIEDTEAPMITINEDALLVFEQGDTAPDWTTYFSVEDAVDGTIVVTEDMLSFEPLLNMDIIGTYVLTITVEDNAGNVASESVSIEIVSAAVVDETAPVITVVTSTEKTFEKGDSEPDWTTYFTVIDDVDGTITVTSGMLSFNPALDMDLAGTYTLTINVSDQAGNTATESVTITVIEVDETAPLITVDEEVVLVFELNQEAPDWVTYFNVTDNVDGVIAVTEDMLSWDNEFDATVLGTYVLTLTVSDQAGNIATESLTLTVVIPHSIGLFAGSLSNLPVEDEDKVTEAIRALYTQLYESGIDIGLPEATRQNVFEWGAFVGQNFDMADSIGSYPFGSATAAIVYNQTLEEAFLVKDFIFNAYLYGNATLVNKDVSMAPVGLDFMIGDFQVQNFENGFYIVNQTDSTDGEFVAGFRLDETTLIGTIIGDIEFNQYYYGTADLLELFIAFDDTGTPIELTESHLDDSAVLYDTAGTYLASVTVGDQTYHVDVTILTYADTTSPVITLKQAAKTTFVVGDLEPDWTTYFIVSDDLDGNITVTEAMLSWDITPDFDVIGTHVLTINVSDQAGNSSTDSITIIIEAEPDTEAPIIDAHETSYDFDLGASYDVETMFTVTDNFDGAITNPCDTETTDACYTVADLVDVNVVGTYTITIHAKDSSGNEAEPVTIHVNINVPAFVGAFAGPLSNISAEDEALLTQAFIDLYAELYAMGYRVGAPEATRPNVYEWGAFAGQNFDMPDSNGSYPWGSATAALVFNKVTKEAFLVKDAIFSAYLYNNGFFVNKDTSLDPLGNDFLVGDYLIQNFEGGFYRILTTDTTQGAFTAGSMIDEASKIYYPIAGITIAEGSTVADIVALIGALDSDGTAMTVDASMIDDSTVNYMLAGTYEIDVTVHGVTLSLTVTITE